MIPFVDLNAQYQTICSEVDSAIQGGIEPSKYGGPMTTPRGHIVRGAIYARRVRPEGRLSCGKTLNMSAQFEGADRRHFQ
jgi:hypothetical protein